MVDAAAAAGGFIGAIACVEPAACAGAGALGAATGRRRTVAAVEDAVGAEGATGTGTATTASGTGTRDVDLGWAEGGVGMPTAGAAGAATGAAPGVATGAAPGAAVAGRRRTVIGRGAPGTDRKSHV